MFKFIKKIIFMFYYQRAVALASEKNYLDAINLLQKAPLIKEETFAYFLLIAFLNEQLFQFNNALIFYDKAKYLIIKNKKLSQNEKDYLYKYINFGYINIYKHLKKFEDAEKIRLENIKISYDLENISNSIKNDFVIAS